MRYVRYSERVRVLTNFQAHIAKRKQSTSRTYLEAIKCLNSLQSGFKAFEENRVLNQSISSDERKRKRENRLALFKESLGNVGIQVSDIDRLNVIHIAGTNGKGSTGYSIEQFLLRSPYHWPRIVALFTSPHIIDICDRFRVGGKPITKEEFTEYFFEVYDPLLATSKALPTYFRFTTLLALHIFRRKGVDVAIIETGVGGQYDSTNVVQHPIMTVITSISLDHQLALGSTIEEIAWHKAGIMKKGTLAMTVEQIPAAQRVLQERASAQNIELRCIGIDPRLSKPSMPQKLAQNYSIGLAAAEAVLAQKLKLPALRLPSTIVEDVSNMRWQGRFQVISTGQIDWRIDGAHNEDGLEAVAAWSAQLSSADTSASSILLFNHESLRDTPYLLRKLHLALQRNNISFQQAYFCTNVVYKREEANRDDNVKYNKDVRRSATLESQHNNAALWKKWNKDCATEVSPTIEQAMDSIRSSSSEGQVRVLVTGDLYLVGGVVELLTKDNPI